MYASSGGHLFRYTVVEPISPLLVAGHMARVVFEKVVHMRVIEWERFSWSIGIIAHAEEGQRCHVVAFSGVEVHIFFVAVGGEEIIADPAFGKSGKTRGIEIQAHFVA